MEGHSGIQETRPSSKGEGLYFRDISFSLFMKNLLVDCLGPRLDVKSNQMIFPTKTKDLEDHRTEGCTSAWVT